MSEHEIDPYIWFGKREIEFCPKHFVISDTPLTDESKQWVLDNIKGRFSIIQKNNQLFLIDYYLGNIAFENPMDATFYELKWS